MLAVVNPILYVWKDEQEQGPFALVELRAQVESGELSESALVRDIGGGDWGPLRSWVRKAELAEERELMERIQHTTETRVVPPWAADPVGTLRALGGFVVFLGLFTGAFAYSYDTAPEGTHNIGLLNDRLSLCILAATLVVSGCLLFCTAFLAHRMGEPPKES
jgi:hypothetical protein